MIREYCKEYGIKMLLATGTTRILRKIGRNGLVEKYEPAKYQYIINWIDKNYGEVAERIASENRRERKIDPNCNIWIFWWQGEKSMPPVVRACYKSVLKHKENHKVVLVTEDNVKEYVDIPEQIYTLASKEKISITHLSDVVREHILYQQGGIWMDATLYMTAPFDVSIYQYEYYSLKGAFKIWPWTSFFQASGKGNVQPRIVSELFRAYLSDHDNLLTYLLLDCFIAIACQKSLTARQQIELIPVVDASVFELNDHYLEESFSECVFKKIKEKSNIHKLSYKYPHSEESGGEKTFWGYLVEEGKQSR